MLSKASDAPIPQMPPIATPNNPRAIRNTDKLGAKAIGIDILIDQPQPDDQLLIEAFQSMKTPTYLAYASTEAAKNKILYEQQVFLEQFQKEIAKGSAVRVVKL